jgi:hypothetical protein
MSQNYKKFKNHQKQLGKNQDVEEMKFVERGIEMVHIISKNLDKLPIFHSLVGVSTNQYELLLRAAYRKDYANMKTGKKDGTNRKLRFERELMLFFDADDSRLIFPIEILTKAAIDYKSKNGEKRDGAVLKIDRCNTVYGAEVSRRMANGESLDIFRYSKSGEYLGGMINGKLMSPEELSKPLHP